MATNLLDFWTIGYVFFIHKCDIIYACDWVSFGIQKWAVIFSYCFTSEFVYTQGEASKLYLFFPIKLPSTYWIKVIETYIPFLYAKHKWLEQKYEWYNQPIQYVHPWYKPYHRSKCFWNILWSLCIVIEYFTWNTTIPWHHLIIPNSRNTHHHYFIIILFNLLYLFFLYEKNRKMGLYF